MLSKEPPNKDAVAFLKFGKVIGQALMKSTNYQRFTCGESQSIGMLIESMLALRAGIFQLQDFKRLENLLKKLNIRVNASEINLKLIKQIIREEAGDVKQFVFPKKIGEVQLVNLRNT